MNRTSFFPLFSWKGRKEERGERTKKRVRKERERERGSPSIFKRNFSSLPFVVNQNLLDMFFLSPSFFESMNWKRNKLKRERERSIKKSVTQARKKNGSKSLSLSLPQEACLRGKLSFSQVFFLPLLKSLSLIHSLSLTLCF